MTTDYERGYRAAIEDAVKAMHASDDFTAAYTRVRALTPHAEPSQNTKHETAPHGSATLEWRQSTDSKSAHGVAPAEHGAPEPAREPHMAGDPFNCQCPDCRKLDPPVRDPVCRTCRGTGRVTRLEWGSEWPGPPCPDCAGVKGDGGR